MTIIALKPVKDVSVDAQIITAITVIERNSCFFETVIATAAAPEPHIEINIWSKPLRIVLVEYFNLVMQILLSRFAMRRFHACSRSHLMLNFRNVTAGYHVTQWTTTSGLHNHRISFRNTLNVLKLITFTHL